MTREEAKKYLMDVSYQLGTMSIEYLTEKDGEKMREAINTLEQEPCEYAISRQAVLDILWHTSFRDDYEYKVCKNKIIELPPVNPQYKDCRTLDEFIEDSKESDG